MYCYVINSTFIIYRIIYNSNKNSEMVGVFIYLFNIMQHFCTLYILYTLWQIYILINLTVIFKKYNVLLWKLKLSIKYLRKNYVIKTRFF